jgi:hypothetical protein
MSQQIKRMGWIDMQAILRRSRQRPLQIQEVQARAERESGRS